MRRTAPTARPKPTVRQQIDAQRAVYLQILSAWTDATHRRMMRDGGACRLYAYHLPSTATDYGQILAVAEGEEAPAGAALIDAEPVSAWKTRPQLLAWITERANWLPMYPNLTR